MRFLNSNAIHFVVSNVPRFDEADGISMIENLDQAERLSVPARSFYLAHATTG